MVFKRFLLASAIVLSGSLTGNLIAQAQLQKMEFNVIYDTSYESLWNNVDKAEKESLPQTAQENVEKIYQQALDEKNSPELIKALIHKMKYAQVTDREKFFSLFSGIEKYTLENTDVVEQSMLYYILAQLYFKYYNANSNQINPRTAVVGIIPDDMEEWSSNIFIQKTTEYIGLSLKAEKELQSTDILKYENLLKKGGDSRIYRPTIYDFLTDQSIGLFKQIITIQSRMGVCCSDFMDNSYLSSVEEFVKMTIVAEPDDLNMQILKMYQNLLAFRIVENNQGALLIADLERLDFVQRKIKHENRDLWYFESLENLEKLYQDKDIIVEILHEKARNIRYGAKQDEAKAQAYQICLDGIRKYPDYFRINLLQALKNDLTSPQLGVRNFSENVYPGKNLELSFDYRNISKLTVKIYRINISASEFESEYPQGRDCKYLKCENLVDTKTISLKNEISYLNRDTFIQIPIKDLGEYKFVVYADDDSLHSYRTQCHHFLVSRLTSISRTYDNKIEFLVVDRLSGEPQEGVKVNLYERLKGGDEKNILKSTLTTGKNGLVQTLYHERDRIDFYTLSLAEDTAQVLSRVPWPRSDRSEGYIDTRFQLDIFTDRSIYRPGQTVYFKAIAYNLTKKSAQLLTNDSYTLSLYDPNGKELAKKNLKTGEMGSLAGEFILPTTLVNGRFSIRTEKSYRSAYFQVEEYKRPSINIFFDPVKETYSFGDKIPVKGNVKYFSGVNIRDTKVKYRVVQQDRYSRLFGRMDSENQVAEGTVQTDDQGKFEIAFVAEKRLSDNVWSNMIYTYHVQISVTDDKGETQESSIFMPVGDISMVLSVPSLSQPIDKDAESDIIVLSNNLNGQKVNANGVFEIYSVKKEKSLNKNYQKEKSEKEKLIFSGNFTSEEKINIDVSRFKSGSYIMLVKAHDEQKREVSNEISFLVYSKKDKQPPVPVYEWFLSPKSECKVGEKTEIIYGSSAEDVYVLYDVFRGQKKIETFWFKLSNSIKRLPITFNESYGDGIVVCLTFIKDGEVFTQRFPIKKELPSKDLTLKMEVFRDKLLPGQKEEWKISVKDKDKNPVVSELLAGMYDISLDKIRPHKWSFYPKMDINLFYPEFVQSYNWNNGFNCRVYSGKYFYVQGFDDFKWFDLDRYLSKDVFLSDGVLVIRKMMLSASISIADADSERDTKKHLDISELDLENTEAPLVQIRKNLNETAFFYPQLRTNSSSETLISFTVPESNTTWKFMALAHTQDMKFGKLIEKTISQKKLMVSPNMPRFIRHGDKTSLTTAISNLSDENLSGNVSISFFDPVTEKETIVVPEAQKSFSVAAGQTTTASWTFEVPSTIDITAVKVVAIADNFSDGEQHLLPVLPNRMLVTESLPLYISGKGNKQFTLDKLAKNKSVSLENYRLTLEFSDNPIWYAIQALPAMAIPSNDDVISWFAAYYANYLAVSIASSTPKIKQVIDVWTKQGGTKETLLSNLEKNQELRAVLLEETPWIMQAKNETEQKQRLSLLFDVNRSANLNSSAIAKLKELQKEDGGWTWFKGMNSDVSVTQWILYGMAQLAENQIIMTNYSTAYLQKAAVEYIDSRIVKHFENLKKYDKNWSNKTTLSIYETEYLLVRSLYPELPKEEKATEAYNFYSNIALKNWAKHPNLYGRTIIALFLHQTGEESVAQAIVASLRQHAQQKEELGMYWSNNDTRVFMFQSATTIHTFIMEAFRKTGASEKEMNAMKLWLLKQKQTQEWESTPATVNAVSALLNSGSDWLENSEKTAISLGDKKIETTSAEIGTGYIKQVYESNEISPEMARVTISKEANTPSWGALYWQYFEDLDKITKSKTGLNVEKMLFKEEISASGKMLVPITENDPLKTGDKVVVRLTVRNDRDMEYVLLKDMRATCFEPEEQLSGIRWRSQTIYYQTSKDASTNFYFYNLPKGTHVFEYPVYVTRSGEYSGGIATIQCMYAPEFVSNTEGIKVVVK